MGKREGVALHQFVHHHSPLTTHPSPHDLSPKQSDLTTLYWHHMTNVGKPSVLPLCDVQSVDVQGKSRNILHLQGRTRRGSLTLEYVSGE